MTFWTSVTNLPLDQLIFFAIAITIAFAFEFINGFHDTANAVTTVIYTRTMRATPAVLYSGLMNLLGVLLGGVGVAFGIVHLLPVELLVDSESQLALVMVLSLLLSGVIWNLGTWYYGLPVSSSHTLIGSILGVGLANSLLTGNGFTGVKWRNAEDVGLALLLSPLIGFVLSGLLLLIMKRLIREPRLYTPPVGEDRPPWWVRGVLVLTCGGVSFAHGSNDGQKGMGLMLLVLIGFLPAHYAVNTVDPHTVINTHLAVVAVRQHTNQPEQSTALQTDLAFLDRELRGLTSFDDLRSDQRWAVRAAISRVVITLDNHFKTVPSTDPDAISWKKQRALLNRAVEFVPFWVVLGTALALGIGTTIGYKRIVITVAEKIGKTHLTYAQGAAAEMIAALTILTAVFVKLPVSTTQVVASGVAGTMAANGSGVQGATAQKILLAWLCTFPSTMLLAATLFTLGRWIVL